MVIIIGYEIFKQEFFSSKTFMYKRFLKGILEQIQQERDGKIVDSEMMRNNVQIFKEMGQTA